jgi:nicotinate-nucleotide adenylyltransferase
MRLGVFGGTFDPVHSGHLRLAACCGRQARLDEVRFIPAASQPHKPDGPVAPGTDRAQMVWLAIAGEPLFSMSTIELDRGGVSYTVETLRELSQREPDSELFLLMGADSLADLPKWREAKEICRLATPVAVRRAGLPEPDFAVLDTIVPSGRLEEIRHLQVEMPEMPISSSEIRRLIIEGGPWHSLVPQSVADYIEEQGLYRPHETLQPPERLEER